MNTISFFEFDVQAIQSYSGKMVNRNTAMGAYMRPP